MSAPLLDNSTLITLSSVLPEGAIISAFEEAIKVYKEASTPEDKKKAKNTLKIYAFLLISKDITEQKGGLAPALKSYENIKKLADLVENSGNKTEEN